MRRALAFAATAAFAMGSLSTAAQAAAWTKYIDVANGLAWSYDADYSYTDKATGRLVVLQAISKPAASLGPASPGEPNGVGSVVALDCAKANMIQLGAYAPSKPLAINVQWRADTPKKADGPENQALVAAACKGAATAPVK